MDSHAPNVPSCFPSRLHRLCNGWGTSLGTFYKQASVYKTHRHEWNHTLGNRHYKMDAGDTGHFHIKKLGDIFLFVMQGSTLSH